MYLVQGSHPLMAPTLAQGTLSHRCSSRSEVSGVSVVKPHFLTHYFRLQAQQYIYAPPPCQTPQLT